MEPNKQYITQITTRDLKEIASAANAYAGDGIEVERTESGMLIRIDRGQLERWVKTIINGGNI